MSIYPGAVFKPTSWGGKVPRNRQGRGMLHVAVSERISYPPNSGVTWHFYVAKAAPNGATDGSGGPAYCEQYVDTEYRAYGGADGNDDQLIVETAGGMGSSPQLNAEPWTRAQELRIADIMRWEASQPGGAPLELLPDSRAGRRGWGPHRLGIKHSAGPRPGWWQPGGEVWSNALGKECPGDAKVGQVPHIIELARGSAEEIDMATAQEILDAVHGYGRRIEDLQIRQMPGYGKRIENIDARTAAQAEQLRQIADGEAVDADAIADRVTAAVRSAVLAEVGGVVRDALGDDNAAQAEEIVNRLGQRLGSGGAAA